MWGHKGIEWAGKGADVENLIGVNGNVSHPISGGLDGTSIWWEVKHQYQKVMCEV